MLIGKNVKQLRKSQRISLSELSKKSGVQIATLSRIEHQKMTGTLDSHMKIAKALGVDITILYNNITREETSIDIHTAETTTDIFVHSSKSSYEILTKNILSKRMMPILLTIEPEGITNKEQCKPGSEKFVFVIEGKFDVIINNKEYSLFKANTLYFDSSQEHNFKNSGNITAKVLVVGTPVEL
ncbi:MAG: XRE family transcriptional regulator [Candidatus Omnitrophica bacterium]|nr:XRE family transcriptional regulator [Candidatus Omnitrophota bacterium]MBU4334067.1 XRE family transcriptional regulator [Candidatus Omnitrophota bacterium]